MSGRPALSREAWFTSLLRRFWSKVDRTDACWFWRGFIDADGYGTFGIAAGKMVRAHRLAWELTNGLISEGQCVCHSCANPTCVRPSHLFVGSVAANNADCWTKGRNHFQKKNPSQKLTDDQVRRIRDRRRAGVKIAALTKEFGVGQAQISRIASGIRRRDVK